MDDDDGLGGRRQGGLDAIRAHVERRLVHVHKHGRRPAQHDRAGGRHKRVGRHDDFVARAQTAQQGCLLQGGGGRVRQQHCGSLQLGSHPCFTRARERAQAVERVAVHRLGQVGHFAARQMGHVENDALSGGQPHVVYGGLCDLTKSVRTQRVDGLDLLCGRVGHQARSASCARHVGRCS